MSAKLRLIDSWFWLEKLLFRAASATHKLTTH